MLSFPDDDAALLLELDTLGEVVSVNDRAPIPDKLCAATAKE